jgi:hypothetical protein
MTRAEPEVLSPVIWANVQNGHGTIVNERGIDYKRRIKCAEQLIVAKKYQS